MIYMQDAGISDAASGLCVDGKPRVRYPEAPPTFQDLKPVPELTFKDEVGSEISLAKYFDPCATEAKLLVLRVTASFCGPCRYAAAHTETTSTPGMQLVDVLVRDEFNLPATPQAVPFYRSLGAKSTDLLLDVKHQFGTVSDFKQQLPLYVFVDARTMKLLGANGNPTAGDLADRIKLELADLRHEPRPKLTPTPLVDELFAPDQWDMVREMIGQGPPADPTNAVADAPGAVTLGEKLFFDPQLSPSGTTSCATCHVREKDFQDGNAVSVAAGTGDRNAPSVLFASQSRFQFWDGRADSLWMQALGPFENPGEFASSRLFVARKVASRYAAEYQALFPSYPLPEFSDTARFPLAGKPGDAAYDAMTAADKESVTRMFVNVGKAIAAYERSLITEADALDKYAHGNFAALESHQKGALKSWFTAGCIQCHWGPTLSDGAFHNLRFPTGRRDGKPDQGAAQGLPQLLASDFRQSGRYSDAPSAAMDLSRFTPEAIATLQGAFKTPILRGTAATGPWGHGGSEASLVKITELYGKAGLPETDARAIGSADPWLTPFDEHVQQSLVAFLQALAGGLHAH